ncbi:hypothetical protein [Candidatus Chlamydia sanziniae]|uniref:Uncharacterized protein n=1 Tax=Candidatus Chlamydia sanziniae TaxID=1806891 RepID=A0A1A9HXA2_9CHLA|nr:hypothetical protein [Candidatus Chlamydia sanziniae]ANH78722.1 hypothetical protein Cs308_0552 [Candidatus Chlamydia sanziniae]
MTDPSTYLTMLRQIMERYFEPIYPTLSHLQSLHVPKQTLLPVSKTSPTVLPITKSTIPKSSVVECVVSPPSSYEKPRSSFWECIPLHPDISREQILKEKYPSLTNRILSELPKIPCGIFVNEDSDNEILFFNRLAKILTQQLFPTHLILMHTQTCIFNSTHLFLGLAPLSAIRYKFPNACYHQSLIYNGSTLLPLYSSLQYEQDMQLKRDLWAILNRLPFAYTQKS